MHSVITEDDTQHMDMQKEQIREEKKYCTNNATQKKIK